MLNDVVHAATGGQLCATAFAVVVDPATRSLTYSSAGHNPPYLWSRTKKAAVPLVARGSRLGESETSTYTEAVATYEAGDRLVLYTDGIVEWPGPKDRQFGDRRFRKAIEARGDVDVKAAADGVLKDATDFAEGRERDDDLTLVVIDLH